jgi:hypothetical protein
VYDETVRAVLLRSFLVCAAALSLQACGSSDPIEENACFHQGQVYAVGAEFPAGDGCNTCTCEPGLVVACTELPCPDADVPDAGADADAGIDAGIDAGVDADTDGDE